jgi:mRNA-degrading endonuclease RelE of RelBE toxin-antitoxin system
MEKCKDLADDPFPGQGDKEILQRRGHKDIYRLHISRSYTAFYKIYMDDKIVKILDIMTIEQAHKIYGRL